MLIFNPSWYGRQPIDSTLVMLAIAGVLGGCVKARTGEGVMEGNRDAASAQSQPVQPGVDTMEQSSGPLVRTAADIATYAGQTALVRGVYVEVDIRKDTSPPPVYKGHAAVQLDDGTLVFLGGVWEESALRPQKERDALRDQEVIAEGLLHSLCPPNPTGATLEVPCLYPLLYVLTPAVQALLAGEEGKPAAE